MTPLSPLLALGTNTDHSAYYKIHDNFCAYGGHKSDFAGHSKSTYNSVQVFPKKDACMKVQPGPNESYYNVTCLQLWGANKTAANPFASFDGCDASGNVVDKGAIPAMHSNTIYTPAGNATVSCTNMRPPYLATVVPAKDWLARGLDAGTKVESGWPAPEEVAAMARRLLGIPAGEEAG